MKPIPHSKILNRHISFFLENPDPERTGAYRTQCVGVLAIIHMLNYQPGGPVSSTRIARLFDSPISAISAIVADLTDRGIVEKNRVQLEGTKNGVLALTLCALEEE